MKRNPYPLTSLTLGVLLLAVLASPLFAATPADTTLVPDAAGGDAPEANMFVWQIPAAHMQPGSVPIRVEILADGQVAFSDEFVAELRTGEKPSAVEVLARHPADRHFYGVLVERGNVSLEARVLMDGVEVDRRPLADLVTTAEKAVAGDLRLSNLRFPEGADVAGGDDLGLVTARGQDCTDRNACMQACNNDYYACAEFACGAPTRLCEPCLTQLHQCQLQCPPCECVDPKSVTTEVRTEQVGSSYLYSQCYADPFWPSNDWGVYWDYWQFTYKKTEVEITEYCDGSTSEEVLDVWYEYGYCWYDSFLSCYYLGTYTPYPQCY